MTREHPIVIEPEDFALLERHQNWVVVDLSSEGAYLSGHIPGAIHLPAQTLMRGTPPVPGKIPDIQQLTELFTYLGLNENTQFFIYDDEGGGWAGRFAWTLDVIGHSRYSYINGGIFAWQSEGLPLDHRVNRLQPSEVGVIQIDQTQLVDVDTILQELEDGGTVIWDARSAQEYQGQKVLAQRGGHIPGAIHCEWTTLMDPARGFRIREDAEDVLAARGIARDKKVITHCQSHHRSGFTYLVGKHLGFDIRGYDGSWSEWGNRTDTPIEL